MSGDSINKAKTLAKLPDDHGLAAICLLVPFISFLVLLDPWFLAKKWFQEASSSYDFRPYYDTCGVFLFPALCFIGVLGFAMSVFSMIRSAQHRRGFAFVLSLVAVALNELWVFFLLAVAALSTIHLRC